MAAYYYYEGREWNCVIKAQYRGLKGSAFNEGDESDWPTGATVECGEGGLFAILQLVAADLTLGEMWNSTSNWISSSCSGGRAFWIFKLKFRLLEIIMRELVSESSSSGEQQVQSKTCSLSGTPTVLYLIVRWNTHKRWVIWQRIMKNLITLFNARPKH